MNIRLMTIDDYQKVYDLWSRTPNVGLNDIDDSIEGISKYLNRNQNTCFIAEENTHIIGVILSGHDGRRGYIHHMAVSESKQRQGIGEILLDRALKALKSEGIHKVALVVFEKNVKGNSFWEKNGFIAREDLIYRNRALADLKN